MLKVMKRLLIISFLILGLASFIKADEKEDSLIFYFQRASIAYDNGNYQDACLSLENTLRLYKEISGDISRDTIYANTESSYAFLCYEIKDYEKAFKLWNEVKEIRRNVFGANHPTYISFLDNLASFYYGIGDINEAIRIKSEVLEIIRRTEGTNNQKYCDCIDGLVNFYAELGDLEKGFQLATQAMEIKLEIFGDHHPSYATSLSYLARYFAHYGNYQKAIEYGTQALDIRKTALGENHLDCALSFSNLAVYYSYVGDYAKAAESQKQAMDIEKRTWGEVNPGYATSLSNLAGYYANLGDYSKAIELTRQSMEIRREIFGEEHPDYATSLNNLAVDYSKLGEDEKAIEYETQALEIRRKILGEENPDFAASLSNLASFYAGMDNFSKAIDLETQALEIKKKNLGENHPDYSLSLSNLANYYFSIGDYEMAVKNISYALEIQKSVFGENHPSYARSLGMLAGFYARQGNYIKALELDQQALVIFRKVFDRNHPEFINLLNNLTIVYSNLGDYLKAIECAKSAMEIEKELLGEEHPDYATCLNNLATLYLESGNKEKAIELDGQALEIRKKIFGGEHSLYALSLSNLAVDYSYSGDYKKAIELTIEALELREKKFGKNHPDYALSLNNLAKCYFMLGDREKAIEIGNKALDCIRNSMGKAHTNYASFLGNLVDYYFDNDDFTEIVPLIKEYMSFVRNNVVTTFSALTANERSLYWDKYSYAFSSWIPRLLSSSEILETAPLLYDNSALFAKGLLLSTELEMTKLIQESGDDEALQMYSELRQNRQMLNAQYSKPIAERSINCDSLERVSNNLERLLVSRVKEFGDYTRNLNITWQDVQSKLRDEDIAIEFLSYTDKDGEMHYAALTLCKNDTAPILMPLFVESKLLEASGDDNTYQTSAADSLVWAPLLSRLEGKSHVYFAASGMLHSVGIEYLSSMEGKECYRLSSTRELVTHKSSVTMRGATLYGDIDYDATYASIEDSIPAPIRDYAMNTAISRHRGMFDNRSINDGVGALSSTRVELEEVSALMKALGVPVDTLMGVLASEESFKALSGKRKSLLHISTHGFYYNDENANNLKPHLRQMLIGDDRPSYAEDRSLLRCGLCFAGANQALLGKSQPAEWQGDGILNALEIAQTDLRGLDLVVLSACETALGDIAQGEGVFGLQRGFKKAGAKTILMSLWRVNDVATNILMVEFYKNYLAGKSKLESLRKAQQYVRDYTDEKGEKLFDDSHYWAGFILLDALD